MEVLPAKELSQQRMGISVMGLQFWASTPTIQDDNGLSAAQGSVESFKAQAHGFRGALGALRGVALPAAGRPAEPDSSTTFHNFTLGGRSSTVVNPGDRKRM